MASPIDIRYYCATMPHHDALVQLDGVYRDNRLEIERFSAFARRTMSARTQIVRIPVVVHVIYNRAEENVSPVQIESQIAVLNQDFRLRNADAEIIPEPFKPLAVDTLLEFGLAARDPSGAPTSGITRTFTSLDTFPFDPNDPFATIKLDNAIKRDEFGKAAWPSDRYLNMWVCSIENGLLGYAQFPGGNAATDGVVVLNTAFGTTGTAQAPFDGGRTAVHEIGHWLNLLHIWGDDEQACSGSDNVQDTPNQGGANTGTPGFPRISCGNGPNGDMFMNYMDYVDDAAMVMFSEGQLERINATLAGPRASIAQSDGLAPFATARMALDVPDEPLESLLPASEAGEQVSRYFNGVRWVEVK